MNALGSCCFLPNYLFEEVTGDDEWDKMDEVDEYQPSVLYMDQLYNLYPREFSMRMNLFKELEITNLAMNEPQMMIYKAQHNK